LYPAAQQEILGADAAYTQATRMFVELAPGGWLGLRNAVVAGAQVAGAERLYGIATRTQPGAAPDLGVDAAGWVAATTIRMDLLHQVEASLDQQVIDRVAAERDATRRQMTGLGVGVLAGVLVMLAWVWWVARSMVSSLTRLRHGAETVAGDLLPDLVRRLGEATGPAPEVDPLIADTVAPLSIPGQDEVGQVAAAFAEVTDRAARMAADQARMRADIRAIFMALANRLQRRIGPVLAALEDAQRDETDSERLGQLFAVDHQVTLVRRIIAGLQIQAGGRAGRTQPRPMALPDVLRAAYGQIAHYQRVKTPQVDQDVFVAGDVVEDLTYLLAELMDNATRFSPDETLVTVQAHQVTDAAVYIGISDAGIGMGPDRLAAARDVLACPGVLDRRTAEQMGLPVAAAIARHLGITIELESSQGCGTRVTVILPKPLLAPAPAPTSVEASATAVLPQVPAAPRVAALPAAPPPSWPLPATQPVTAPVEPVQPVIFEEVNSWFTRPQQGVPTVLAEPHWQRAAQVFAQPAASARTTAGGLPVRQPGALVIEAVTTPNRPRHHQPAADADATSRRIASLHDGLRAAGLKNPARASREERQP
ncbi:MAG: sensor histidine kinase, partial [Micromonosporaceae bacterium]|nr:sensor histidine kinase [Micromonosporaceae bacterium]